MTRMQAARVLAKRRAEFRQKAADAHDLGECQGARYYLVAASAINDAWRDLSAAWDSEAPARTARKGKE